MRVWTPLTPCWFPLTARFSGAIVNQVVQYSQSVDTVAAAIADPTRRAIIDRLTRGPARISDLAEPFAMSLTGFCKHVKVLERAGLVKRTRQGRENTLEFQPLPLRDVSDWVLKYKPFWNQRLDRLEQFFKAKREKSKS
jgi:DNA-binding transcriptional ArsR family regulator